MDYNNRDPRTIAELEKWYHDRHLPPYETTRFFIGYNYQGRCAFGIYRDGPDFVVYKNKDDGTRAIRYRGPDEAYAVNELLTKLKSEIMKRKQGNNSSGLHPQKPKNRSVLYEMIGMAALYIIIFFVRYGGRIARSGIFTVLGIILLLTAVYYVLIKKFYPNNDIKIKDIEKKTKQIYIGLIFLVLMGWTLFGMRSPKARYYQYEDNVYCKYDGEYYRYSPQTDNYYPTGKSNLPTELLSNLSDYIINENSYDWSSQWDFNESEYYESHYTDNDLDGFSLFDGSGSSSNSDSVYDWDSGSDWDSGDTDWSSDW